MQCWRAVSDPWIWKILWRREWQLIPVFLPGESRGQRSLAGYSPWGHKESDMSKLLSTAQHIMEQRKKISKRDKMALRHIIFNHDLMQYINSCNTICVIQKKDWSVWKHRKRKFRKWMMATSFQTYFGNTLAKISSWPLQWQV